MNQDRYLPSVAIPVSQYQQWLKGNYKQDAKEKIAFLVEESERSRQEAQEYLAAQTKASQGQIQPPDVRETTSYHFEGWR